jgi:acetyl esterase/lipase
VRAWVTLHPRQDLYIMGESYGGLLASGVALSLEDVPQLKGLVLINPATSFPRTVFPKYGDRICSLPGPLYSVASAGQCFDMMHIQYMSML